MNVLFLTMSRFSSLSRRGIYSDLIHKFCDEGHTVYMVTPLERFLGRPTELIIQGSIKVLGVRTLNLQKSSILEKGIGQVLVEGQYKRAINKYLKGINFDLILFSTPPITLSKVILFLKRSNPNAKTYLLLKDIFPQNAIDIGMMTKNGIKGPLYRYFRNKEKKLYQVSDFIGCMSPANVKYILAHNPEISIDRVEVAPNSVLLMPERNAAEEKERRQAERNNVRIKYNLPIDKPIFIYGGNLGRPQGIPYLIRCLQANSSRDDCFILVIGTGTELKHLQDWYKDNNPKSVKVMQGIPKNEYDMLVRGCDVGMIFLDHRFTIPNYPSRLLSYLENRMPVICATDPNTDIGRIAEENGYGYWCESNSVESFTIMLEKMIHSDRVAMGEKGYDFMKTNYQIENTYNTIVSHV